MQSMLKLYMLMLSFLAKCQEKQITKVYKIGSFLYHNETGVIPVE